MTHTNHSLPELSLIQINIFFITGITGKTCFGKNLFHYLVDKGVAVEYNNGGMVHFFNQCHPKFLILDFMKYDLVQMEFITSSPTHIVFV